MDVTLLAARSVTKNNPGELDSQMWQTERGGGSLLRWDVGTHRDGRGIWTGTYKSRQDTE